MGKVLEFPKKKTRNKKIEPKGLSGVLGINNVTPFYAKDKKLSDDWKENLFRTFDFFPK